MLPSVAPQEGYAALRDKRAFNACMSKDPLYVVHLLHQKVGIIITFINVSMEMQWSHEMTRQGQSTG